MPIVAADIKAKLSGGAANADPNASLGGAMSTTEIDFTTTLHNLFDKITGDQASAGHTDYRCLYVENKHATLTWEEVKLWIQVQTPSIHSHVEIALAAAGKNGTAELLADETTAPSGGESFETPTDKPNALDMTNMAPDDFWPIYVKRVIQTGASAYDNDGTVLRAEGDTAA